MPQGHVDWSTMSAKFGVMPSVQHAVKMAQRAAKRQQVALQFVRAVNNLLKLDNNLTHDTTINEIMVRFGVAEQDITDPEGTE